MMPRILITVGAASEKVASQRISYPRGDCATYGLKLWYLHRGPRRNTFDVEVATSWAICLDESEVGSRSDKNSFEKSFLVKGINFKPSMALLLHENPSTPRDVSVFNRARHCFTAELTRVWSHCTECHIILQRAGECSDNRIP